MKRLNANWRVVGVATAILLTLVSAAIGSEWFSGKVVSITDGDTIGIMRDGIEKKVRLDGIDCPEMGQDFGMRAKQACSELIFGKVVNVEVRDVDKYARLVARVYVDGKDVSLELVRRGFAWHYTKYSDDLNLAEAEIEARESLQGVWSQSGAIAPWNFRHPEQTPVVTSVDTNGQPQEIGEDFTSAGLTADAEEPVENSKQANVFVTASGKKFHSDGCRYLSKSKIPISLEDAQASGYAACSVCGGTAILSDLASTSTGVIKEEATVSTKDTSETQVYITNTGSKYHQVGCRYLSKSKIPISLKDASASGYSACSVCASGLGAASTPSAKQESPSSSSSSGEVHVKGYYRKDGTYVRPHTRSKPKKR